MDKFLWTNSLQLTPLAVDWSYCSVAVTEIGCWILKEIRALVVVSIVFFVAVVVLFVLPPVVASPVED